MRLGWIATSFLLLLAATPALAQEQEYPGTDPPGPSPNFPVCYVCGSKNLHVTKPENVIHFPGQDPITCERLEYGGLNGYIDPAYCPLLAAFKIVKICGCAPIDDAEDFFQIRQSRKVTEEEVEEDLGLEDEIVNQETETLPPPLPDFPTCYICGSKALAVTKPENHIKFPGQEQPISCEKLEYGGLNGFVNPSYCPLLGAFQVAKTCGCAQLDGTEEDGISVIRKAAELAENELAGEDELEDAATIPDSLPDFPVCYVCGSNTLAVTKPDNQINFPGQDSPISCEQLELGGLNGFVNPSYCPLLGAFKVPKTCGCAPKIENDVSIRETQEEETEEDEYVDQGKHNQGISEETKDHAGVAPAPSPGYPTCYVCGSKTKAVTKPNATVAFPGVEDPVPCYKVEYGGLNGFISSSQCPMLNFFKVPLICGCKEASAEEIEMLEEKDEEEAVESVAEVETEAQDSKGGGDAEVETHSTESSGYSAAAPAPSPGYPICYICNSKTKAVTKPNATVTFPGVEKPVACFRIEYGGLNGFISTTQCPMLNFFKVPLICGCKEASAEEIQELEEEHEEEAIESVAPVEAEVLGTNGTVEGTGVDVKVMPTKDHEDESTPEQDPDQDKDGQDETEEESSSKETTVVGKPPDSGDSQDQSSSDQQQHVVDSPGYPVCYVCGTAKLAVTRPHAKITFPGQRPIRCSKLEFGGLNGYISPKLCPELISEHVPETCGCEPIAWHTNSTSDSEERDDSE